MPWPVPLKVQPEGFVVPFWLEILCYHNFLGQRNWAM